MRNVGTGIYHDPSGEKQADFIHCCHCGRAVLFASAVNEAVKGRAQMSFCSRCNHPCCHDCTECVPVERQIENMEAGRLLLSPTAPFAAFPHNPLIG